VSSSDRVRADLAAPATFGLAQLVCEVLGEVEPLEPSSFGAAAKDLKARGSGEIGADLVHAITAQLGAAGDVYVAGDGKTIVGGAARGKPFYVIGRGARSPQMIAYDAAFFATGVRAELPALAVRCARGGTASVALRSPSPPSERRLGRGVRAGLRSATSDSRRPRSADRLSQNRYATSSEKSNATPKRSGST